MKPLEEFYATNSINHINLFPHSIHSNILLPHEAAPYAKALAANRPDIQEHTGSV